jgi:hypothetical protein
LEYLRTVFWIDEGKIRFDKGEVICNGAGPNMDQGFISSGKAVEKPLRINPGRSPEGSLYRNGADDGFHCGLRSTVS